MNRPLIAIKGAGDLASGVAHRLFNCGFAIVMLEIPQPTVIRRTVSYAEAIFRGDYEVEGITAKLARSTSEVREISQEEKIAVIIDPEWSSLPELKPIAVIDAILAKKNLGTFKNEAPIVIGLGPGFSAGIDVHAVIETQRGHDLGKVIYKGSAAPNTGKPGIIGGVSTERLLRAPLAGAFKSIKNIGDYVNEGDLVATVGEAPVRAEISGVLRGCLRDGIMVTKGFKIGDIDPRDVREQCFTISDKARSVGGAVLEALMHLLYKEGMLWTKNL